MSEIRLARVANDLSQRALAAPLGWSQADYWRFETQRREATLVELATVASVLGLELGAGLHPVGEAIRDKGHQALIKRFRAILSPAFRVLAEVPLPNPGDRRAWDLVLRLPNQIIGVEAETRVRDIQWLVRRMHERERDGGSDVVLLVLANTRANHALAEEVRLALGPAFAASPRKLLSALRGGQSLSGSGVVLV